MKSNTFNYSLLAVGVAAVMGISTGVNAAQTTAPEGSSQIVNTATAEYKVGNLDQPKVTSNSVTVNISEVAQFSLVANDTGVANDDTNENVAVIPTGFATFEHRLTNDGNLTDEYTMTLADITPSDSGDNANYDLSNSTVTYAIYNASGIVGSAQTVSVSTFNATKITLKVGEYANITVNAKTINNKGGDTQKLTLTATSSYLTKGFTVVNADATLTNTDDSITRLPVLAIVKSITDTLDLNKADDTATYTITVTNNDKTAYGAAATDITIIDNLPAGLKLASPLITNTVSGEGAAGTVTRTKGGVGSGTADDGFTVSGVNLALGASITITFVVQKDSIEEAELEKNAAGKVKDIINHASVKIPLKVSDTVTIDIIDSTDNSTGAQNTSTYYPAASDSEIIDGTASGNGGDSTQSLTANKRSFTVTPVATPGYSPDQEVPNITNDTTKAKYETIIANTGNKIEGDVAGELVIKITDTGVNTNVQPDGDVTFVYDADGVPSTTNVTVVVSKSPDGTYDIHNIFPGGIAPGGTVTVKYNVTATTDATGTGTTETTTVSIVPGGTDAPTIGPSFTSSNTTSVEGLTLVKSQALDAACNGTADTAFDNSTKLLEATPGQCVVYKITATNTFTALDITDLVLADKTSNFKVNAIYNNDGKITVSDSSVASTVVVGTAPKVIEESVYGTVTTLAAGKNAVLTFSIKTNENGQASK